MNKDQYLKALEQITLKFELYSLAGKLNNFPEHVAIDKVTFMGIMEFDEAKAHVLSMINAIEIWA
jgi:hypothetical protein